MIGSHRLGPHHPLHGAQSEKVRRRLNGLRRGGQEVEQQEAAAFRVLENGGLVKAQPRWASYQRKS